MPPHPPHHPTSPHRHLVWFLRLGAVVCGSAIFAVFMPREWMAFTNRSLGLGEFPPGPLVDYLARSLSAMYCLYGLLLFLCSTDLPRYRTLLRAIALTTILAGPLLFWMDLQIGLPAHWAFAEGPVVTVFGLCNLALQLRLPAAPRYPADSSLASAPSGSRNS